MEYVIRINGASNMEEIKCAIHDIANDIEDGCDSGSVIEVKEDPIEWKVRVIYTSAEEIRTAMQKRRAWLIKYREYTLVEVLNDSEYKKMQAELAKFTMQEIKNDNG